ncbi:putative siroheme synthase domain protein, partial [Vibrio parahaemolyticus V-223/04]
QRFCCMTVWLTKIFWSWLRRKPIGFTWAKDADNPVLVRKKSAV